MSIIQSHACVCVHRKNQIKIFFPLIKQNKKQGIKTDVYIINQGEKFPSLSKKLVKYYPKYE